MINSIQSTTAIVVIVYNIPSSIFLLQMETIGNFCKDTDYAIEIFDNSSDLFMSKDIRYHCENLGLNYHRTFASSLNGSDSHSFSANLSYHTLKNRYNLMFYMDHDLIPVKPFSVYELLGEKLIAGLGQGSQKTYFWPGCVMFNNEKIDQSLIDFSPNSEYGLDTGGNFYKIIEKYGVEECRFFNESYHENPYFKHLQYGHYSMINDEMFMHFVNSSNWNDQNRHDERLNSLKNIAIELITKQDEE